MTDENPNDDPLLRSLRELPGAIPPARDLWPGIAAAIEAAPAPRRRWNLGIGIAAACAGIVIASLVGYIVTSRSLMLHKPATAQTPPAAKHPLQRVADNLVSPTDPRFISAAFGPEYFRARSALLARLTRNLQTLSPADRAKVKSALEEIDKGLEALNAALVNSPDSILLQQLVLSAYQQQLQTLQNMAEATAPTYEDPRT